jgi:methionyl-tRNA formyltransferase
MRLVFVGSPPFATPAFAAALASRHACAALVTAPPARAGRGRAAAVNPLAESAAARGVRVLRPESAHEEAFLAELEGLRADLGVVVSYGQILTQRFLASPRLGCVNVHASLLPRWRGASPVQAAILAGDARTGVCVQRVVEELDAGAVLAERATPIGEDEDAPALLARLSALGAELLREFLDGLDPAAAGLPPGRSQDPALVTHCRKLRKEHGVLDWSAPAAEIARRVRAFAGWPCARTALPGGEALLIHRGAALAEPGGAALAEPGGAAPGAVLRAAERLIVACGAGAYEIFELQREGRARLTAREFLRGAALAPGDRLGPLS